MNYGGIDCRREFTSDQKTRARNAVENTLDDLLAVATSFPDLKNRIIYILNICQTRKI